MDSNSQTLRDERRYPSAHRTSNDYRSEVERDYGRLIHSPSFRRLQSKSQVFGVGSGDYYRTRLTHTLEVAQIARHTARILMQKDSTLRDSENPAWVVDPEVVECAALAHDLGHPPFGHIGEQTLDQLLIREGYRFEGNAQDFRLLMFLEKRLRNATDPQEAANGLDLTAAVLLATNKYPRSLGVEGPEHRPDLITSRDQGTLVKKGLYPTEWQYISDLRRRWGIPEGQRTLEAQLMDFSDDIAYSTHDLEDGIRAGKIQRSMLQPGQPGHDELVDKLQNELSGEIQKNESAWSEVPDHKGAITEILHDFWDSWERNLQRSDNDLGRARRGLKAYWVNEFASHLGILPTENDWRRVTFVNESGEEYHSLRRQMAVLKKLAWIALIQDVRVQRLEHRSALIIRGLWKAFLRDRNGNYIPSDWRRRYEDFKHVWPWPRFVADYIAGMTDGYAEKVYGEMYGGARSGSIYEVE